MKTERVLPFPVHRRCALRAAWEPELEKAMLKSLEGQPNAAG